MRALTMRNVGAAGRGADVVVGTEEWTQRAASSCTCYKYLQWRCLHVKPASLSCCIPTVCLPTCRPHVAVRAPAVLHLGLHNSLSEVDASCGGSCTVTLFAPYWFNNRTGGLEAVGALVGVGGGGQPAWYSSLEHAPGGLAHHLDPTSLLPTNRFTGVDLFYQDRLSAPAQPLLLGHPLPWDYGEMFTPGGCCCFGHAVSFVCD